MRLDTAGRVRWKNYPDGSFVGALADQWTYDGAARLKTVPGFVTATVYDSSNNVLRIDYANLVFSAYAYVDAHRRLTVASTAKGANLLQGLTYTRDAAGRITAITNGASGANNDDNWTYAYDALDRLTSATNAVSGTTQSFTWSPNGRLLTKSNIGAYVYPAQGVATGRPHAPVSVAGQAMSYDANGNLVGGQGRVLVRDAENRRASVSPGGTATIHGYGLLPDGRAPPERRLAVEAGLTPAPARPRGGRPAGRAPPRRRRRRDAP